MAELGLLTLGVGLEVSLDLFEVSELKDHYEVPLLDEFGRLPGKVALY